MLGYTTHVTSSLAECQARRRVLRVQVERLMAREARLRTLLDHDPEAPSRGPELIELHRCREALAEARLRLNALEAEIMRLEAL